MIISLSFRKCVVQLVLAASLGTLGDFRFFELFLGKFGILKVIFVAIFTANN